MWCEIDGGRADLAVAVDRMLTQHAGPDALRAAWTEPSTDSSLWRRLADMDLPGLLVDPELGGAGGDLGDAVVVAELIGRHAAPEPFTETVGLLGTLVDRHPDAAAVVPWRPGLLDGTVRAAAQLRPQDLVAHLERAQVILVRRDDAIHLVAAADVADEPASSIDHTRRLTRITAELEPSTLVTDDPAEAAWIGQVHTLLRGAETLGLADRLVSLATTHAGQREQFGRPIGSFQAIKHALADSAVAIQATRSVLWSAAQGLAAGTSDASHQIDALTGLLAETATLVSNVAQHTHGGLGFTWESDVHLYLKRLLVLRPSLPTVSAARERTAARLFAASAGGRS